MRPASVSVTGVATSAPLVLDPYTSDKVGVFLVVGAGCTVSVEQTDDPFAAVPVWYAAGPAALAGATANVAAQLTITARGLRLNQTVGANTTTMKAVVASNTM